MSNSEAEVGVEVDYLSGTYAYQEYRIFESNGQKYIVGLDTRGFVSIESGEIHTDDKTYFEGYPADEQVTVNFPPEVAREVGDYITELANGAENGEL